MKRAWIAVAAIVLAVLALLAALPRERADLASPEDTAFLWDGLYLGKQTFAEVPYVSTPYEVVDAMIRMAAVRADDVVYDLGCGDGRLVIEAVKRAGMRHSGDLSESKTHSKNQVSPTQYRNDNSAKNFSWMKFC